MTGSDLKRKELEIAQNYNTKFALLEHQYAENLGKTKTKWKN